MKIKICEICGSNRLISDRSLGGKLICSKCGSSKIGYGPLSKKNKKRSLYLLLVLIVILIIVFI